MTKNTTKFKNFLQAVDKTIEEYPDWRLGQALFNTLAVEYPQIAEKIRGSYLDTFHSEPNDDTIKEFLDYLEKELSYEICVTDDDGNVVETFTTVDEMFDKFTDAKTFFEDYIKYPVLRFSEKLKDIFYYGPRNIIYRLRKGFPHNATWSMDYYTAKHMLPIVKQYKKDIKGFLKEDKERDEWLDEIIWCFEWIIKDNGVGCYYDNDPAYKLYNADHKRAYAGFKLFGEKLPEMWW